MPSLKVDAQMAEKTFVGRQEPATIGQSLHANERLVELKAVIQIQIVI
jgi:hypothetical protein